MCDICRMYECPAMCPNAPEEPAHGECAYCAKPVYRSEEGYALPDNSIYHSRCLSASMEFLEIFELAALFGKDENLDEDEFTRWYDSLSEEELAEELCAEEL